jgi:dTDP-4-amino-4,6-dideoxygalactose transaminase
MPRSRGTAAARSARSATALSLYATKNIAAGEGGLISTNRDDLAEAIDDLRVMRRGHGSTYDIAVPGYKANLSDVLSSIALVQLDKIEQHAEIRRRHVAIYGGLPASRVSRRSLATHATTMRTICSSCA